MSKQPPPPATLPRPVVTVDEAAGMLRVSRNTIGNYTEAGLLKTTKVRGRRLVFLDSIQELLDSNAGK
jgi:excisionase family DNA binding protein